MFPFSVPKLQISNMKTLKTSCKLPKSPNFTVLGPALHPIQILLEGFFFPECTYFVGNVKCFFLKRITEIQQYGLVFYVQYTIHTHFKFRKHLLFTGRPLISAKKIQTTLI